MVYCSGDDYAAPLRGAAFASGTFSASLLW